MADRGTETYRDAQGRLQTRDTVDLGGTAKYKNLSTEDEAKAGTKKLFSKEETPEKPKSEMTLGELAAYNKKKREAAAKEQGQKQALGGM